MPRQEMTRQHRHIAAPITQRRQRDVDSRQPIGKVLAKPSCLGKREQLDPRCRNHADIDDLGRGAPDGPDLVLFDELEQLVLEREREVINILDDQRTRVGEHGLADDPRECAFLMPEKL